MIASNENRVVGELSADETSESDSGNERISLSTCNQPDSGFYRCSRCHLPKKDPSCQCLIKIRRKYNILKETRDVEVQVEIIETMTVRFLNLYEQGFPMSYISY